MANTGNHKTNFYRICLKGWRLHILKGLAGESQRLRDSEILLDGVRGPFQQVYCSRFANVTRSVVNFHGHCHTLYLKEYFYRSFLDVIKHLFRPSRAKRAFNAALMLEENGFSSPEIIALGELRKGFFNSVNFLITRELAEAEAIYNIPEKNWLSTLTLHDKRDFLKQLGKTIGRMHGAGIFHGDLRVGNIFAEKSQGQWRFFFLDNERTKKYRHLPKGLRLKNLVQINMLGSNYVSNTDRMRFFKSYCEQGIDAQQNSRDLARIIMVKTHGRLKNKITGYMFTDSA
jgi:tRNA A-37 threonylcarbamoyl transferase component Bud32